MFVEDRLEARAALANAPLWGMPLAARHRMTAPTVAGRRQARAPELVDIDMPGLDGLSAAEALHEQLPACRTLVLTGLSQPGNLLRALKVHVRGFLLKDAPAPELANAIRSVAMGRRVLDPELV